MKTIQEMIDIYDKKFEEEVKFFANQFQDTPPTGLMMPCGEPSNQPD
jgi:hypothetical protein